MTSPEARRRAMTPLCLLLTALLFLSWPRASCRAQPVPLTDETFDSVRETFSRPSMLILVHAGELGNGQGPFEAPGSVRRAIAEFDGSSDDGPPRDGYVMLATVDAAENRMLAARMGVRIDELPSIVFLRGDRVFRYRDDRLDPGEGEALPDASYWLLVRTACAGWLAGLVALLDAVAGYAGVEDLMSWAKARFAGWLPDGDANDGRLAALAGRLAGRPLAGSLAWAAVVVAVGVVWITSPKDEATLVRQEILRRERRAQEIAQQSARGAVDEADAATSKKEY